MQGSPSPPALNHPPPRTPRTTPPKPYDTPRMLTKGIGEGSKAVESIATKHTSLDLHTEVVLHKVLYLKAHANGFEKKKKKIDAGTVD